MNKIAFYIMNSKGFYVLKNFIEKFGSSSVAYVVSSEDKNIQKDFFDEIKELVKQENIKVEWMDYSGYKEYEQLNPPFEHGVTILDLIFNEGDRAKEFMKSFK